MYKINKNIPLKNKLKIITFHFKNRVLYQTVFLIGKCIQNIYISVFKIK